MSTPRRIVTVGLLHIVGCKLLLTQPRGKGAYYLPGGKPLVGEDDVAALFRETKEELGVDVVSESVNYYDTFIQQAYGEPSGVEVAMACYMARLAEDPAPTGEIETIGFFSQGEYEQMPEKAPAVRAVMARLKRDALID